MKPRRETQRPLLPQHARHCPVLEAGNALGFLVYPPLEKNEAIQVGFLGDGKYYFTYFLGSAGGKWQTVFQVNISLPVGSIGMVKEEVVFKIADPPITKEGAIKMAGTFIVAEDLGTPTGGITLRGATNFKTPPGWDTVYCPVLNLIERPIAPMLVVRVETDWYPHESEFRYVLQPGESMSGTHNLPIGQVFFVPREEITTRECTEGEIAAIWAKRDEFLKEKAATKVTTRYGMQYSPQYIKQSRESNPTPNSPAGRG
jgi:hypothetical protein